MVFKRFGKVQCSRGKKEWDNYVEADAISMSPDQVPTGRWFQLRDGSGSGIAKNFGFGFGYGSSTGICTIYLINRVLSGNKNIDRVFFRYINMAFSF